MHDRIEEEEEKKEKQGFQVSREFGERERAESFEFEFLKLDPFPFILAPVEERSKKHFPDVYFLRETGTRVIIFGPMLLHWRG